MNVVLAGEESAGLQVLRMIAASRHRLIGVLAKPPKPETRGSSVWHVAQDMGFETWPAALVKDPAFADRLRERTVDVLLNVHSLFVIRPEVLAATRLGAFNLHPGPLPRYAGLNAVSWAIYRGEQMHGVTVHKMEPGIDTGAIVYQTLFPIQDTDTALTLSFKCIQLGVPLLLKMLDVLSTDPDSLPLRAQSLSNRQYFGAAGPQLGLLSWEATAEAVINFVRACDYFPFPSPWGYPRTYLRDRELGLVKASRTGICCQSPPGVVGAVHDGSVQVACVDEWIEVHKVKVSNKYVAACDVLKKGDRLHTSAEQLA